MQQRIARTLCSLFALLCLGSPTFADPLCLPSAAVQGTLETLSSGGEDCEDPEQCRAGRVARLEAALGEHPGDYFLRKAVVDQLRPRRGQDPSAEFLELRERLVKEVEAHPEDPLALDLAARVVEADEDTWNLFERATEADPSFPWSHLALGSILAYDRDDPEGARAKVQRFLELCPLALDRALYLNRKIKDDAFWEPQLTASRKALQTADPSRVLDTYSAVWQLAFQVKPPVEFPQVRAQITADLERLQVLEQHDRVAWLRTLAEGYELTSDTAGKERVQARLTELQPCSMSVLQNRVKAWEEANPRPEEDATEEVRQAHNQGILDFTLPLLERCPGADLLWLRAVTAAGAVKPPREDLVDQGAERLLAAARAGRLSVGRPMESHLADIYLQAKLDPERAYSLIQAASRSRIEDREKKLSNEGLPESFRQRIERMIPVDDLSHLLQLTRAETRTGRLEESRSTLEAVEAQMEIVTAAAEENEDFASSLPRWRARIFREYGDLAEAEGRRQDAALYLYRAAALGNGEETAERAAALWRESGGTAAAWAALSGEASEEETPPPGRWDDKGETLPALALSDLKGKSWGWTEFEGKTVLANIWATWCAPCRAEHPYIQKLHEQLKDRDDLKIITLNVDFNPGVVTPYLEENGYSFPVLLAMDYVEEVVGSLSIPRNWLLRGDGTLLKEQLGFDPTESEAEWLASTLTLLEAAAGGEAASD